MKTFLEQIAEAYYKENKQEMADICFVFPNKRSCDFFQKNVLEISRSNNAPVIPNVIDITSFVLRITNFVELTRIEQIFLLYNCYSEVVNAKTNQEGTVYFDHFLRWADILLSDFNDVDMCMADAEQLFTNVKNLQEIKSDWMTPEMKDIIDRFYGKKEEYSDKLDLMWKHYHGNQIEDSDESENNMKQYFYSMWMILYDLYTKFRESLKENQLCYTGMAFRIAAENMNNYSNRLHHKRYVFIGFNALSAAEKTIFKWMRDNDRGDFYWDDNSPFLTDGNPGGYFVKTLKEEFKSKITLDLDSTADNDTRIIHLVGVPSKVGQVKYAVDILKQLNEEQVINSGDVNTAIVLPDERLCPYLLRSIPAKGIGCKTNESTNVNVTMGYPMSDSPVSSLIQEILKMEYKCSESNGEITYLCEDILSLLSHPLVKKVKGADIKKLINKLQCRHRQYFKRSDVLKDATSIDKELDVSCFFPDFRNEIEKKDGIKINIVASLENMLNNIRKAIKDDPMMDAYINTYLKCINQINILLLKYNINTESATTLHLVQRLASTEKIPFKGEPLSGIQVMGVLETRSLDFDNLIFLSMNEKVYPRRMFKKSLIPYELRKCFQITTPEMQEGIFAYYFYRLLNRSKRVYLLYDCTEGGEQTEMSRYIYQLQYIYAQKLERYEIVVDKMNFDYNPVLTRKISLQDNSQNDVFTKDVLNRLYRYTNKAESGHKYLLSPSALKAYISCPLKFFLEYVADYRVESEIKPFVDSSTFGTIIHEALQTVHKMMICKRKSENHAYPQTFYQNDIKKIIDNEDFLTKCVVYSFLKNFLHRKECDIIFDNITIDAIPEEFRLLVEIMRDSFVKKTFERELESFETLGIKNYQYIASEYKFEYGLPIDVNDETKVLIKGFIDRIDIVTFNDDNKKKAVRIIDYKTGNDALKFKSIDDLFGINQSNNENLMGIFQVFLYSLVFKNKICTDFKDIGINCESQVIPLIYKLRTLATEGIQYIKSDNGEITDFSIVEGDFGDALKNLIQKIFDTNCNFSQNNNSCNYCNFRSICNTEKKNFF
ncbi:MAG: PD-(D/E)XK nuclease family protein [Muribaculaceae bacterium]